MTIGTESFLELPKGIGTISIFIRRSSGSI
jgi:hypothetical protein